MNVMDLRGDRATTHVTCYTLDDDSVSLISVVFPFRFMIMTFTSEGTTKKAWCGLVIIIIII